MGQSDEFSGRLGLIFASIGAAVGTGNIWRFPRMVGANGGGTFLIPWLFFLFVWSIPLVIAEFSLGKRSRTGTVGTFRIFAGRNFAWMGLWTAWISTAIGFYYAVVAGWCLKYFSLGLQNGLTNVDTTQVWNEFLQSGNEVIFFQFLVIIITLGAIMGGAKAIEKVNVYLMVSLFILLFLTLFLSLWMDIQDGSLDGFLFMFTVDTELLMEPEIWINGLSQSAWSCSAGMGMAITYSVYMKKDEDTVLNAFVMGLANNSISIIAGLAVLSAIFSVSSDPLAVVTGGSSAITFLALPEVFAQAPGGEIGAWVMMSGFFLALSFAALTSMISTVELCVRNFVDHGIERTKAVWMTAFAIFMFGIPSALIWIRLDSEGVAFPAFLEVQDHIWGFGLMFSGLFIAFSIWKYGWSQWRRKVAAGESEEGLSGYLEDGVSAFRDEFINTGDNDLWVGKWWDYLIYLAFPILFLVLFFSYFGDLIFSYDPWITAFNPVDPHGAGIIFTFWGVVAISFMLFNKKLANRPLFRNVPDDAECDISTLPGGDDELVVQIGDVVPGWEHLTSGEDVVEAILDAEISA
ncbi:MAG: sodium-dependent transporter [Euryarchaeota archaeon]|jgi:NSS family neurotransmitter:Na+ symporter|nr:sodium-dependent transporter [Euryarchaeota archaeon]MBT3971243.1 sodium-dependent transporter [Euryarchaeota archaeon]MBT4407830.1 sodium-dependent transporter [Euryarchaeota archaeon]MBT6645810.1 sodium-dependent transporter [Euryarchaeota archaeon]